MELQREKKVLCGFRDETNPEIQPNQMRFLPGSCLCSILSSEGDLTLDSVEQPEGNMGKPGIPGSISIFAGRASSLFTSLFLYLRFPPFHTGQRSYGSGPLSPALISKSQVESCPAMELLASLSHSSLTRKQLMTRAARILFCFPRARRTFCHDHRLQCVL